MFSIKPIKEIKLNTLINLPNYISEWLNDDNIHKILFLYTYIRVNQMYIDSSYQLNVNQYLSLLYNKNTIRSKWKRLIENLNCNFKKLKDYKLITTDVIINNKNDIIVLANNTVTNDFEDGSYTLMDYSVIKKILNNTGDYEKDRLLLFCLFLNNRARDALGYTSYEDMGQICKSDETINKYLTWFKDNEIFDYYSTSHKLNENGVPIRGNTVVSKWVNRGLVEKIKSNDTPSGSNSVAAVKALNERFENDKYYAKMPDMLKSNYGLTNNFLLQRLWNQLPYGFTWKAIYKYLNNKMNAEYFNDDVQNVSEVINKIVNVAKKQEVSVMEYDEGYEGVLYGREYEKNHKNEYGSDQLNGAKTWGEDNPLNDTLEDMPDDNMDNSDNSDNSDNPISDDLFINNELETEFRSLLSDFKYNLQSLNNINDEIEMMRFYKRYPSIKKFEDRNIEANKSNLEELKILNQEIIKFSSGYSRCNDDAEFINSLKDKKTNEQNEYYTDEEVAYKLNNDNFDNLDLDKLTDYQFTMYDIAYQQYQQNINNDYDLF